MTALIMLNNNSKAFWLTGAIRQGLKRQLADDPRLVLFDGKSDWNELLCGSIKQTRDKATKAESPAAGSMNK